jgi:hypothetical protein
VDRIIEQIPKDDRKNDNLWCGRTEPVTKVYPSGVDRTWPGRTIERVIHDMNGSLGPVDEKYYKIKEGE